MSNRLPGDVGAVASRPPHTELKGFRAAVPYSGYTPGLPGEFQKLLDAWVSPIHVHSDLIPREGGTLGC